MPPARSSRSASSLPDRGGVDGRPTGGEPDPWVGLGPAAALVLALVLGACGSTALTLDEDPAAYADEVQTLQDRLADDPSDATALRDLGAIYVRTGRPTKAYDRLKKAYGRRPTDPKTIFFLGLASERVGKRDAALRLFQKFDQVPPDSRYRSLLQGRYEWLVRQDARTRIRDLVARERALSTDRVAERAVAVLPLQYNGTADRYQPLGRGLAEMMTTDLANVERLRVVERVRVQALLDELKLAQRDAVDPSTAPRVGRLLGAGRLVGGSYFVTENDRLQLTLDLASVTEGGRVQTLAQENANLDALFRLQTRLVFDLVRSFGIDLTDRERDAIEEVPTRDLQAFLAYSRGLLEEDRGNFGAAARQFNRAQTIDATFQEAARGADRTLGLEAAAGPTAKAVNAAVPSRPNNQTRRMVGRRVRSMMGIRPGARRGRSPLGRQIFLLEDALRLPPPPPPPAGGS